MRTDTTEAFKMPPLARNTVDEHGMKLLRQWIEACPARRCCRRRKFYREEEISPNLLKDFEKRTGRDHSLHFGRNCADNFRFTLRKTNPTDRPDDFAREGVQAGLHQKHHDAGNFHHRQLNPSPPRAP